MSNIKQLEQNTPLPPSLENDNALPSSTASAPLRPLDPALLRQFVQLLSQQQGQLPPEQAQKLQPLLRQLTPLLVSSNDEPTEPVQTTPSSPPGSPSQQLLQRIFPMLPSSDPLLRQTISYGERNNLPLAQLQQQPQLLQELMTRLPAILQESREPGRALTQWLLQLVTLRTPNLTPQSSGNQALKNQLQQLQIALPTQPLLDDKRGQAQLQSLTRETLQLLAKIALPVTHTTQPEGDSQSISPSSTSMAGEKRGNPPPSQASTSQPQPQPQPH